MTTRPQRECRIAIVGSGPAGYTAAIYAARAGFEPVLIDGPQPGGQLTITTEVENFPGFPEGIQGPELMERCRRQAARFGTEFVSAAVASVDFSKRPFVLRLDDGTDIIAETVIVATGARARLLGLESERELMGRGVSACATCDGFFFRDMPVAVIGGGDSALEEASFLSRFASKVMIVHRRDAFRASKVMRERVLANPKIELVWDSVVEEILGTKETGVTGLRLRNVKSGEPAELPCQGVFVAIGHDPSTQVFAGQLDLVEGGYLRIAEPGTTLTSVPGVFAAGDAGDPRYRQAIWAAGSGCGAALDAERFLSEQDHAGRS